MYYSSISLSVKSTLKRKIPLDKLDAMDKQNAKTELETYVCIGECDCRYHYLGAA
jgi:hypothetical protein